MKKTIMNLCFLGTVWGAYAQTVHFKNTPTQSFEQQIEHIYQHLDLTQVPTGLLADYGLPLQNLDDFQGQLSTGNKTNMTTFGLAYASLYSMAVAEVFRLPDPAAYREVLKSCPSDELYLTGLHQKYAVFRSDALSSNLLREQNGMLYDVPNRPTSPYLQKEVFLVSPNKDVVQGEQLKIRFDSRLFFNGSGKTIQSIAIDAGNGYNNISMNESLEIKNLSSGNYTIKIKVNYTDGSGYESHFEVDYQNTSLLLNKGTTDLPYDTPDMVEHITAKESFIGAKAGATIYVSYACGHTSLQKPFIWCEGYNPQVNSIDNRLFFEDAVRRLFFRSISIGQQEISQYLMDQGYDLVVVDYDDGGDYLRNNALLIEEVIRWLNAEKARNGSKEKNVVMGQSMGGMIARVALRRMEINGEDHETETYISFDSGHLGTNIPMGVQYATKHIAGTVIATKRLRDFVEIIADAEDMLNLPASRDMLIYYVEGLYLEGVMLPHPDLISTHDEYYDYQNRVLGMPQKCEVLAIANGSLDASKGQAFDNNELVLDVNANRFSLLSQFRDKSGQIGYGFLMLNLGLNIKVEEKIWSLPNFPLNEEDVYYGKINVKILNVFTVVASSLEAAIKDVAGLDASPGGFAGVGGAQPIKTPANGLISTFKLNAWSFTPTVSTLNYYANTSNYTEVINSYVDFQAMQQKLQADALSGVKNYAGVMQSFYYDSLGASLNNTAHTHFNSEIAPFMLYHLVGDNGLANVQTLQSGQVYNFGKRPLHYTSNMAVSPERMTSRSITKSLTIESGGVLAVNHYNGLGFDALNTAGGALPAISHLAVQVIKPCTGTDVVIKVKNGAVLHLGNGLGRVGEMHFGANTRLIVESGGLVEIHADGNLAMHDLAALELQSGATLMIRAGARLFIDYGALLEYAEGAHIYSEGTNCEIALGGTVHLAENATFNFDHSLSNGSGFVRILEERPNAAIYEQFTGETGSMVSLDGKNAQDEMLVFDKNALLIVTDSDLKMNLTNLSTRMEENSGAILKCNFTAASSTFHTNKYVKGITFQQDAILVNCEVHDVLMRGLYPTASGHKLVVRGSDFTGTAIRRGKLRDYMIEVNGGGFVIDNVRFKSVNQTIVRTANLHYPSSILNSDFTNNPLYPAYLTTAFDDYSDVEIWVTQNAFSNLYQNIGKASGKLSLKCNTCGEVSGITNTIMTEGTVNMTTPERSGYNVFKGGNTPNLEIYGGFLNLNKGYNQFKYNQIAIVGTLATSCDLANNCKLTASQNQWGTTQTAPPANAFDLYSSNGYPVEMKTIPTAALAVCGSKDPKYTPIGNSGLGEVNLTGILKSQFGKSHVPIETALQLGIDRMRLHNPNGDDREAMAIFDAIFESTKGKPLEMLKPDLQSTLSLMKTTLENGVQERSIQSEQDLPVQQYLKALNRLSNPGMQSTQLHEQFLLEIDKMHLLRLFNRPEQALIHLLQLESCGLPKRQQDVVNHWKTELNENLGANFKLPIDKTESIYFGSYLTSLDQISYVNCSGKKLVSPDQEINVYSIFPNPTESELTIQWGDNESRQIQILDATGKKVLGQEIRNGQPMNLTLSTGIYTVLILESDKIQNQSKLVIH